MLLKENPVSNKPILFCSSTILNNWENNSNKKKLKRNTGSKLSSQHNHGTWFMKSWKSWIMKITKSLNHENKEKTKMNKLKVTKKDHCGCKVEISCRYMITRFKYLNSWQNYMRDRDKSLCKQCGNLITIKIYRKYSGNIFTDESFWKSMISGKEYIPTWPIT